MHLQYRSPDRHPLVALRQGYSLDDMSIGSGIALFVIGAILAFAFTIQASWIDLHLVGYILMGAGIIVFVIGLVLMFRRRQTTTTVQHSGDPAAPSVTQRTTSTPPDDTF
jgi:small neutral amino acid transporter SnatA (MarC family)